MHVRHNFITKLNEIIGHLLGGDFGQAEVTFRINQAWVHCHSTHVLYASVSWNFHFLGRSHSGDFPVLYHQHTVFNGSMRDREQLAALEHNRLLRTCVPGRTTQIRIVIPSTVNVRFILPPCSVACRSPAASDQSKRHHQSEPCRAHRSLREDSHPKSPDQHLCPLRLIPRDSRRQ